MKFFVNYINEKNGKLYLFCDKNQLMYQDDDKWKDEFECRLVLTQNCRNTVQIGTTSNNIIDSKLGALNRDIEGDIPNVILISTKEKTIKEIEKLISSYKERGFRKDEITILTLKTEQKSILKGISKIGQDELVNSYNGKDIVFTTSRKFKGLESNAVIIIDLFTDSFIKNIDKRNFYVAVSRARQKLEINPIVLQ